MNLLDQLITDEKKSNTKLYSSGEYWNYKNLKTIHQIKKKGISNFRGLDNGIGTSFTDSIPSDIRNELGKKGRIVGNFFSLPFINKIFNNQINLTKNYITKYLETLSIVYSNNENVKKLILKYKFLNTVEYGCISKFIYNNKEHSTFYLEISNRIEKLSLNFDFTKLKSFFEIGGGFGANVHFLVTNFPNIKKIIYLDATPNIYLGTQYLKKHFGKKVKDYLYTKNLTKIEFENNDELEIICIPPWEIEKLEVKIDHFHNCASFVEMPKEIVENYCWFIKKFNTKEISLLSYDKFDNKTTFNPELLNNFFDNKLKIVKHDTLIPEFKKKLIYLCSK